MIITELFIPGRPVTKGSLTRKGDYLTDTPQSKAWRRIMAGAIRDDLRRRYPWEFEAGSSYPGPVAVRADWFLPVAPTARGAGDLDKLLRNLLDALSAPTDRTTDVSLCAGAIVDDNQVTIIDSSKHGPDLTPGVLVCVRALQQLEIDARYNIAKHRSALLTA